MEPVRLRILRGHVAPYAVDAIYQGVVRSMHCERAGRLTGAFLLEFDVPQRKEKQEW